MTQSHLLPSPLPVTERWTLWSRRDKRKPHWRLEGTGREKRIAEVETVLNRRFPGLETLILPPGERPLEGKPMCHRERDVA